MNTFKHIGVGVLSVSLMLMAAASGRANTIGPLSTSTPISGMPTDWTGSLAFPMFDTSLGTLNSVTLTLSGSLTTQLSVINTSLKSSSGTAQTEVQFSVQDPGNNLVEPGADLDSPTYHFSLSGGSAATSGLLQQSVSAPNTYTLGAVLGEFQANGGGTIMLPAETTTYTHLIYTGGNTFATQNSSAGLSGTVTYDYTPAAVVPEPATFTLLGVGMIGLLGFVRRQCKRSSTPA